MIFYISSFDKISYLLNVDQNITIESIQNFFHNRQLRVALYTRLKFDAEFTIGLESQESCPSQESHNYLMLHGCKAFQVRHRNKKLFHCLTRPPVPSFEQLGKDRKGILDFCIRSI